MPESAVRGVGLVLSLSYAIFIVWLYVRQPQTMAEVTGALTATIGAYRVDEQAFSDGLELFRRDQFEAARSAFERADPAARDARTQFYIAYSYYRSGWHPLYHDDRDFQKGLEYADKAVALAGGRLVIKDPYLSIRNADELRAELAAGLRTEPSDFNPMRIFKGRK